MKTCSMKRRSARLLASSAALCALLASTVARAQAEDQAAARALFEDGRRLLKNGQYQEACRRLEAASKLYASPGILLNLGDCYEKVGRSASAWTEFGEAAASAARARRNDQIGEAKRRQSALEPKLTRLTIRVSREEPGLAITRDQIDVSSAAWGEAIPVDPGTHEIRAEASGYQPWSTSVVVSTPGQTVAVDVPALTASPTPPPPPPGHEAEGSANSTPAAAFTETPPAPRSHALDWALIGGGVAVGIVGGVLWNLGASHARDATNGYNNDPSASFSTADHDYKAALLPYYVGLAGVIVGGATATAGVILLTLGRGGAHRPAMGRLHAAPWVSSGGGGLQVAGGW
jgi:tetratricopeptide (TPR) repeat protein